MPMRIVTVGNLKGGSCKTTTSLNVAVAAAGRGIQTVIIDLDPQQSAGKWADQRSGETPAVLSGQASRLDPVLREAERLGAELVLMDTAAHEPAILKPAIEKADVVLIPTRPIGMELQHIMETATLVAEQRKPVAVVLCAVPPRAPELDEARRFVEKQRIPLAPLIISDLRGYARAVTAAQGVTEREPSSQAAAEINALLDWLIEHLKITTSKKSGKKEGFLSALRERLIA
jgi:chromosome partitioning protein